MKTITSAGLSGPLTRIEVALVLDSGRAIHQYLYVGQGNAPVQCIMSLEDAKQLRDDLDAALALHRLTAPETPPDPLGR